MLSKRSLPLGDFLANLQTFDIILMQGILATSQEAEALTSSNWSHVGMVVVAGDLSVPDVDPKTRLLWEANTPDNVCDVLLKKPKLGPQLTVAEDRIKNNFAVQFDGTFGARKLMITRTPSMFETLTTVIHDLHPAVLPVGPDGNNSEGLLLSFLAGRFQNQVFSSGTYFCSQLVARTYMDLGLMTQAYVDNSYAPVDFTEALTIPLLNGAWLGPEVLLDNKTIPLLTTSPQ